jgi:hypothetical protein
MWGWVLTPFALMQELMVEYVMVWMWVLLG